MPTYSSSSLTGATGAPQIDPTSFQQQGSSGPGTFSQVLGSMGAMGGTIAQGFGKNVVSAGISAAFGGGTLGQGLSALPTPPGGGGFGGGFGGGVSGAPGSGSFGGLDPQQAIDGMFQSNTQLLILQTHVQQLSQNFQSFSNLLKADNDARSNAIRNFRS
jgi:hypothetical protein